MAKLPFPQKTTQDYWLAEAIDFARVAALQFRKRPRSHAVEQYYQLLEHMFPLMAYAPEGGKDLADGTEYRQVQKITDRVHPDVFMFALAHADGSTQRSTALSERAEPFTVAERNANILRWQAKQASMAAIFRSPEEHERLGIDTDTSEYLRNAIFKPRTKWAALQDLIDNQHKFTEGHYWRPRMRANLPLALKKLRFETARTQVGYRRMQTAHLAINRLVDRIMAVPHAKREKLFSHFGGSEYHGLWQGRTHTLEATKHLAATLAASVGTHHGSEQFAVDQDVAAAIFHSLRSKPTRHREARELVRHIRKEEKTPGRPKFSRKSL